MQQVSKNKAAPIIASDNDLITVNHHTFINTLEPMSTIVDLGGNKGGFSKVILNLFSCKRVLIVEGNPKMLPFIKRSTKGFSDKTEVINALIGPEYSKGVDFHISTDSESSLVNKSLNSNQNFIETIQVEMITMNEIHDLLGGEKIDLLKVDIEGMEWEVLEKFTSEDFEKIDQITVEFHNFLDNKLLYKTENVKAHLESLGYIYVKGNHKTRKEYFDCFFCKPHLYEKYMKLEKNRPENEELSLRQRYINKEYELIAFRKKYQALKNENLAVLAEKNKVHQSLSWKITAPFRKLASMVGF